MLAACMCVCDRAGERTIVSPAAISTLDGPVEPPHLVLGDWPSWR